MSVVRVEALRIGERGVLVAIHVDVAESQPRAAVSRLFGADWLTSARPWQAEIGADVARGQLRAISRHRGLLVPLLATGSTRGLNLLGHPPSVIRVKSRHARSDRVRARAEVLLVYAPMMTDE